VKGTPICWRCQKAVIWASRTEGGAAIAVEKCAAGAGDVAFQTMLVPGQPELVVVAPNLRTGWRRHEPFCPGPKSYSGPQRRKEKPIDG